jgi:molecular chaperone GrpE
MDDHENKVEPIEEEIVEDEALPAEEAGLDKEAALEDPEALYEELEAVRRKSEEYLDGWQRARAEFANYKKRVEREQALVYQNATGSIVRRYIEILDDLERALKNRPNDGEGAAWSDGIELIYRKLLSYLEAEGVKKMEAEGQFFDPNLHEAITQEDSDHYESGQVIEVVQPGYFIGDRVLRPAMVRVAR